MKKMKENPILISTLLGAVAGFLCVIGYRDGNIQPFSYMVILIIPGIILSSWVRVVIGLFSGLLSTQIIWVLIHILTFDKLDLGINGREALPLVIHATPGLGISTPYPEPQFSWQISAIITLAIIFIFLNTIYLALMQPFIRFKLKTYFISIFCSALLIVCLYPLSWGAKLSGTFRKPMSSSFQDFTSLLIFMLLFPLNMFIVNLIANKLNKDAIEIGAPLSEGPSHTTKHTDLY